MLRAILTSTILMGASTVVVMGIDLVRVKIIALFLGPTGVGALSVLNQFYSLAVVILGCGLGPGITRYVSSYTGRGDDTSVDDTVSLSFQWMLLISVLFAVPTCLLSRHFSTWMLGNQDYWIAVALFVVSLPLSAFPAATQAYLQGLKKVRVLAALNIGRGALSLCAMVPLVYFLGLPGAALSTSAVLLVATLLNAAAVVRMRKRIGFWRLRLHNVGLLRNLLQYGFSSLVVGMAYMFTGLLVRVAITRNLGVDSNGLYQPVWALTMTYLQLLVSSISTYVFPRICELNSDRDISDEMNGMIRIALLLLTPILLMMVIGGKAIVYLLYSSEFSEAALYLPIQVIGGFSKVLFYGLGMHMLPTKRLKTFLVVNLLLDAIMVGLAFSLVGRFGLYGIAFAFTGSHVVATVVEFYIARSQVGFSFWPENRRLIGASLLSLAIVSVGAKLFPVQASIPVAVCCVGLWAAVSVRRKEISDFSKLLGDLQRRIQKAF